MPTLTVIRGPDAGRQFDLSGEVVVLGRHSTNPVPLTDPRVSRRHCEIRITAGQLQLVDLGSGNGTIVNGTAIQTIDLRTGDRIEIGETLLEFAMGTHAAPSDDGTRVVVRTQPEYPSAILKSVPADDAGRIFTRPDQAGSDWLRARLANLAVMYEASDVVSEVLDVDQLLGRIVDLVLHTTDADHGCVLLLDPESGALMPKAVRSRQGRGGELVVSRTVAEYVLKEKQGVLIADAGTDDRFRAGESVARHSLREVICVPMKGRRDTVGVIFLDTAGGSETTRFSDDHLRLAVAVAHQAALAVEETRYYQALIQAERLAAVGQTIASLSHHIKNIMQGVRFGSDMVRTAIVDNDRDLLAKGWRLVEKNQGRIDDLILDMLNLSKDREPLFGTTDLNSLVTEVLEMVRGRAGDIGASLTFTASAQVPPVSCDADGIQRAVLNVVSNALDAVAGTENPAVTVELTVQEGFAEIRVQDTGVGIPADRLEDIFKPFVSSKGARGTGLGLPASRKTLREHGGDVLVASEPGRGTTFTLRLPLTPPARSP